MNRIILLVDAHVHIHVCYDINIFLRNSFENFSKFAKQIDKEKKWVGVLFLTEIEGVNHFNLLKNSKIDLDSSKFKVENTDEENSLIISNISSHREDVIEEKIIIIAGKQIIVNGGIEILALGTSRNIAQNNPLEKTVSEINESGAIAVLPWGFGKWFGKRKEIIKKFIEENKNRKFFLGDNSGRPSFWPEPDIYKIGKSSNHFILAGTDALAISAEVNKTGSYGFYFISKVNMKLPAKDLLNQISNLKKQPNYFGKLENLVKFFKNQITMQIQKRTNFKV